MWSSTSWTVIKDVLLTGTGMALVISQVFARTPSGVLLVTGLALTVPSVAGHATALLSGGTASRSSDAGPSSSPPPAGKPPEDE